MPADVAQAKHFLLHSDYPTDILVALGTLDFTMPGNTWAEISVPHGYGFSPLMWGSWSTDSNYSIVYNLNSGPISSNPTVSPFASLMKLRSSSSEILLYAENNNANPVHFYCRIWGFQPTTADVDTPHTYPFSDSYQFNTDYNYLKLYRSGYYDAPAGTGTPFTYAVLHNLGEDSQILVWAEYPTEIVPLTFHDAGDVQNDDVTALIDGTQLLLTFNGYNPAIRVHYRMYVNE